MGTLRMTWCSQLALALSALLKFRGVQFWFQEFLKKGQEPEARAPQGGDTPV